MEWFLKVLIGVLLDKMGALTMKIFKDLLINRGISIRVEKNLKHMETGNQALSNGDLNAWLESLNKEE